MVTYVFSSLANRFTRMRIGHSYDLHNLISGRGIKLAGVFIPCNFSIEAVSDGDIVYHVISESIIGALCLGDLGDHFREDAKNLDSKLILEFAKSLLQKYKYQIINIDLTIILDKPMLSDYKKSIKANLLNNLSLKDSTINVKATTTETNFQNTIQAHCIVLIERSK